MVMKLSNISILITGGATGIGYALAQYFLKEGYKVLICGRRKERLVHAKNKSPELETFQCDVTNEKDRHALFEYVKQNFPTMNVLINNAGIQRDVSLTEGLEDLLNGEDEIKVNLEAPIHLTLLFMPFLKQKNNSYIINVSSGLGFIPAVNMPIYSATKAGLHAFTKALRQQCINNKTNVRVIEIIPPAVDTELNPIGRQKRGSSFSTKPEEFVEGILKKLLEDDHEIGFGFTENVMHASHSELNERFKAMNSRM